MNIGNWQNKLRLQHFGFWFFNKTIEYSFKIRKHKQNYKILPL